MKEEEDTRLNELLWKSFFGVLGLLTTLCLLWVRYVSSEQAMIEERCRELSARLTVIESSRCTASDCSTIRNDLVVLRSKVANFPEHIPPKWFEDKVNGLALEVKALQKQFWESEGAHTSKRRVYQDISK